MVTRFLEMAKELDNFCGENRIDTVMISFSADEKRILTSAQISLALPLKEFSKTHILVSGTVIASHLYHRKSIDFDFFGFGYQGNGKKLFERSQKTNPVLDKNSFFFYLYQLMQTIKVIIYGRKFCSNC